MIIKNPLQSEAGFSNHRADDEANRTRNALFLQWEVPIAKVSVTKDAPFYRVLIERLIAENHLHGWPLTYGTLASAKRPPALTAKIIGGNVVSNAGGHG